MFIYMFSLSGTELTEDHGMSLYSAQVPQHKNKLLQTQMTLPYTLSVETKMVCFVTLRLDQEDDVFDFHRTDGEEYKDFLQGEECVDATPNVARQYSNDPDDKYQQFRFDFRRLTYFIDDDGYLVARLNKEYDHTTQGPK